MDFSIGPTDTIETGKTLEQEQADAEEEQRKQVNRQLNKFRALTKLDPGEIIKYLYLRAFFKNDMNDRRIINRVTDAFLKDLCFNLLTGKVTRSTSYLDKQTFKDLVSF